MGDAKIHNDESLKVTRWANVIEELREWPSDASEWESDQVSGFVEQVRLIADRKSDERKKAGRMHLQRALDQLRADYASEIVFFEFENLDIANWLAADCPTDEVSERAKTVGSLLEQLNGLRLLKQQSPENFQETRKHRTDLNDTEDRINSLAKQLDQGFAATKPEPEQTQDEEVEDDDDPGTEPPKPGKGTSGDRPDSDEQLEEKKETHPSEEESKRETSSTGQKDEAERLDKREESEPKPTQPTTSAPQPPEKKPPTLRSVQDVAALLQKDDSDENWESLSWSLLAEGDSAGAYWLVRSLRASGRDVPVAPELLTVLQGSRWLEDDADSLVRDILEIASDWAPQTTTEKLLGLAAALRPSLIAPHAGLVGWLPQRDEVNPAFGALSDAIRVFARAGFPLRNDDLRGVENQAIINEKIDGTAKDAGRLLENNQNRRLIIPRATHILRYLVEREGDLSFILTPVKDNQVDQIVQVRERILRFQRRAQIVDRIHQIDQELASSRPSKPLSGVFRDQLVRSVEEAVTLADNWCSLIEQQEFVRNKGDWWTDQVKELHDHIHTVRPEIKSELDLMQRDDQAQPEAACGYVLRRAFDQVVGMLGLEEQSNMKEPHMWMRRESISLQQALARRLLWLPEVSLDDDGYPGEDNKAEIATFLRQSLAEERELSTACSMRIEGQDFRFTDVLQSALKDDEERRLFVDRNEESLKGSRTALLEGVAKVRSEIEQGMVDGLLVEKERTNMSAAMETAAIEEPLRFGPLFRRLDDIEKQLKQKRADRLQELESQWAQIRQVLEQKIQVEQLRTVEVFFDKAFQQSDTRVVDEGLAHLREVLQGEREWESAWFAPPYERDILTEFQVASPVIESGLTSLGNVNQLASTL